MNFRNSEINGFSCWDSIVRIFDRNNRLFYFMLNPNRIEITFNLPPGEYRTENKISKLKSKIIYVFPPLPEPEKEIEVKELELIIDDNPNKASINVETGQSFVDPKFMDKEQPMVTFVVFHELSHNLYKTEWKCDINAAVEMIKRGFNPSQCCYASEVCLSDRASIRKRKDRLYKFLNQIEIQ